jgi:hypothetical protein
MSLAELDQVILGGRFSALDDFPVGLEPGLWPRPDEVGVPVALTGGERHLIPVDRLIGQ